MPLIRNWRDEEPIVNHMSAIVWGGLRHRRDGETNPLFCLERLRGFARHALQGRKTSDHHQHRHQEQVYYIIAGRGEVLCGERRYPVEEGDAVYLPTDVPHQMFNTGEAWVEHHVISAGVEGAGGACVVRNWRDAAPEGDGAGAVRWRLLGREGEGGALRGMAFVDREAVQPRGRSAERTYKDFEQVYYVLEGEGTLVAKGDEQRVVEGDMIHLAGGTAYHFRNPTEGWLVYYIVGI
jgi:mannose-6-phosphate isomerase-like protein (cupin superfamily)